MVFTQIASTTVRLLQHYKVVENRDKEIEYIELNKITTESRNGCLVGLVSA